MEMVMELSEVDQTLTEVLGNVELLPVEALTSLCLEKPSPQPHDEEGAGEQLHPALPKSKETRNSSKLLSCP